MDTRTFEPGQIVRVPFPYTDRSSRQRRPALVVSARGVGPGGALAWVVMITAAENRGWKQDIDVGEPEHRTGLPIRSVIRAEKIATVEIRDLDVLGQVDESTLAAARAAIGRVLGDDLF